MNQVDRKTQLFLRGAALAIVIMLIAGTAVAYSGRGELRHGFLPHASLGALALALFLMARKPIKGTPWLGVVASALGIVSATFWLVSI